MKPVVIHAALRRRDDFSRAEADSPLECPQGKQLDAIFCCVGGGGLLAGVLAYVKQVRPEVLCYGVEARDAAAMTASCFEGEIVELDHVRKKSETRKHSSEPFYVLENRDTNIISMSDLLNDHVLAAYHWFVCVGGAVCGWRGGASARRGDLPGDQRAGRWNDHRLKRRGTNPF